MPHLCFWGGLFLLFSYQNRGSSWQRYFEHLQVLSIVSVAVYINLYFLMPRFFLTGKYVIYALFLSSNVFVDAYFLTIVMQKFETPWEDAGLVQNMINTVFMILITSSLKFFRDNNRKQLQINALENAKLKADLSLLKAQLNPHFFFNSLNNLYGMVLQNRNQQASKTILELSGLMRYLLETHQKERTSLKAEIQFIRNYLALERIRIAKDFKIQFETSLTNDQIELPPLLFIPLVENIFKHAVDQHTEKGFASISLSVQGEQLFFEVKNSFSAHFIKDSQKSGRGLENLQKRLELLYPGRHRLTIDNGGAIYKVTLFLAL